MRFTRRMEVVLLALLGASFSGIVSAQAFTEFPIPTASSSPYGIAAGPDGNLWFGEPNSSRIGRITTAGVITEFSVPPTNEFLARPEGIAAGPDGNPWFTELEGNKIGRITTAGVITEFNVPTASSQPYGIATGPDGNLWFTESASNKIGRITTAGAITGSMFPRPTAFLGTVSRRARMATSGLRNWMATRSGESRRPA